MIELLWKYREGFIGGLIVTAQLCGVAWVTGLLLGSALGAASAQFEGVSKVARTAAFLLAGIPILVLLFWLHYPAQAATGLVIQPFITAAFALSLVNTIAVSETVRPVLEAFPRGIVASAQVCGLTSREILWRIKLPLVVRHLAGPILTLQVSILQASLFASLISVEEVFRVAQRINAIEYRPIPIYSAVALLFLLICVPLNALAWWLRKRFSYEFGGSA